jgi:uncharacterized protein
MPDIQTARSWYPNNDPVHGFDHVLRVYNMAARIAHAEGADEEIVRAAALLHDAKGPGAAEGRAGHQHASAAFARQVLTSEGWPEARVQAVEHCIRTHRFRADTEKPQTLEAKVLYDADKLDAIGATGAVRAVAYAVLDGQPLLARPSEQFIHTGEKEPGEPHSPYHEYLFKLSVLKDRMYTPTGRAIAEQRHHFLANFFEQWQAEQRAER